MDTSQILRERLKRVLDALPITARKASMEATGKPDAIRFILSGRSMPSADRLEAIARVLMTTPSYLLGSTDDPSPLAEMFPDAKDRRIGVFPPDQDVSEYSIRLIEGVEGISLYGDVAELSEKSKIKDFIGTNWKVFNFPRVYVSSIIPLPAGLLNRKMIYGFHVTVGSVSPRYNIGEVIIVDPSRPPAIGDYVIAYLKPIWEDIADVPVRPAFLGCLASQSEGEIVVEQHDPPHREAFKLEALDRLHRIIPATDMLIP